MFVTVSHSLIKVLLELFNKSTALVDIGLYALFAKRVSKSFQGSSYLSKGGKKNIIMPRFLNKSKIIWICII